MAYRTFPDGNGDTIKVHDNKGVFFAVPLPQFWENQQLTARSADVLVCSYPRSGTHWGWENVHMLLNKKTEVTSLDMKAHMFELASVAELENLADPRVIATHQQFQNIPPDFIRKKIKMVIVNRDPKDICVSSYKLHKDMVHLEYSGTFDGFIKLFLDGNLVLNSWSGWLMSFEKGLKEHPDIPYHVVHYEHLLADPVKELRRLAEFLEADLKLAEKVAEQTQFSVMKKAKTSEKADDTAGRFFKENQSNSYLFVKGESGRWKDWFTDEQAAHFENTLRQQLGRSDITPLL